MSKESKVHRKVFMSRSKTSSLREHYMTQRPKSDCLSTETYLPHFSYCPKSQTATNKRNSLEARPIANCRQKRVLAPLLAKNKQGKVPTSNYRPREMLGKGWYKWSDDRRAQCLDHLEDVSPEVITTLDKEMVHMLYVSLS